MAATKSKAKAKSTGSKKAAPARPAKGSTKLAPPRISDADVLATKAKPEHDTSDNPGFVVTIRGSLPKVLASIVLKKGPIRARTREAAIARFMSEIGTQIKKPEVLDVEECGADEIKVARAPMLPFQKGTKTAPEEKGERTGTTKASPATEKPGEGVDIIAGQPVETVRDGKAAKA